MASSEHQYTNQSFQADNTVFYGKLAYKSSSEMHFTQYRSQKIDHNMSFESPTQNTKVSYNNSFESDDDFSYSIDKNNSQNSLDRNGSFHNIFNNFSNLNFHGESNKSSIKSEKNMSLKYGCNDISMDYEETPVVECINGNYHIKQVKSDQTNMRKRLTSKENNKTIVKKVNETPRSNKSHRVKMIFLIISIILIPLVSLTFINTNIFTKRTSWEDLHNTLQSLKDKITQPNKFHSFNFLAFKNEINSKLFGQHLAKNILVEKIGNFFGYSCFNENNDFSCVVNTTNNLYNKRVLSLVLFGQHGTGKSFVAQMMMNNAGGEIIHRNKNKLIEDELFDSDAPAVDSNELSSDNPNKYKTFKMEPYHLVMGFHFTPSSSLKPQIFKEWILHNIQKAPNDVIANMNDHNKKYTEINKLLLFVFDDFEKASEDLKAELNIIIQEINNDEKSNDDGLKILFILTTNTASNQLTKSLYNNITGIKNNRGLISRDNVVMDEILNQEDLIKTISNSWINSFWKPYSNKPAIDFLIPFLPMERKHVKLCIVYVLDKEGYADNETKSIIAEKVANELLYSDTLTSTNGIDSGRVAIALSGCKKINSQIALNSRK